MECIIFIDGADNCEARAAAVAITDEDFPRIGLALAVSEGLGGLFGTLWRWFSVNWCITLGWLLLSFPLHSTSEYLDVVGRVFEMMFFVKFYAYVFYIFKSLILFLIKDHVSEWKNENGCVVDVSVDMDASATPPLLMWTKDFFLNWI